jgi:hypothetical protein
MDWLIICPWVIKSKLKSFVFIKKQSYLFFKVFIGESISERRALKEEDAKCFIGIKSLYQFFNYTDLP